LPNEERWQLVAAWWSLGKHLALRVGDHWPSASIGALWTPSSCGSSWKSEKTPEQQQQQQKRLTFGRVIKLLSGHLIASSFGQM